MITPSESTLPQLTLVDVVPEIVRILRMESKAIEDCAQRLQAETQAAEMRKAIGLFQEALDRGGKVIVTGVGKSGKIGQKIAATLCSTGSMAVYLHPTEGLHGDLGLVHPNDVILALSYTGNTDEILKFLPALKARRVSVVGLGGNSKSTLAAQCELGLTHR